MAIKKSELYSSLWKSCDELRGGMDASQYKDYVLVLLFVKYVSDKYAGQNYAIIEVPEDGSFSAMVALKGDKEIGDKINKIIAKLAEANDLKGVIDVADFNDTSKLGKDKDMQDRLSNLIAIFENPGLDFSRNRANGDDILGDAYEYLMRHFATESGKSKGQFYTPAEVSRVMAKVIGINNVKRAEQTIYDPTCGSGSLLLKAADEAGSSDTNDGQKITIYGQEMDNATAALAKMNMILHDHPTAEIWNDNTLSRPYFKENDGSLKLHDFVVANPPFSNKTWSNGFDPANDQYDRFVNGTPPKKNGDYAYLLHVLKSLKSKGKGAIIMPHGVLFRGNSEAEIRRNIIRKGYIKGVIGLPPNLFYGTGIPACIIILDKEHAANRQGIFMIDASRGFKKDGNKNRLRDQDIHKIVDVFNKQTEIPKYSRMVSLAEIEGNDYNLNIPRYIDSTEPEDIQDIEAHLLGGIPNRDIEALNHYWQVFPPIKDALFAPADRPGYSHLKVELGQIRSTILAHHEFKRYDQEMTNTFQSWKNENTPHLKKIKKNDHPNDFINTISEALLSVFADDILIDKYAVYQHLMTYWADVMQDDVYMLVVDGWQNANKLRTLTNGNKAKELATTNSTATKAVESADFEVGKQKYKADLIPPALVIQRYFSEDKRALDVLESKWETLAQQIESLEEEHGGDDGLLFEAKNEKGKLTQGSIKARLKDIKGDTEAADEFVLLNEYLALTEEESAIKKQIKEVEEALNAKLITQYQALSEDEVKTLVVDDKWLASLAIEIQNELGNVSQTLTGRVKQLAERYAVSLPKLEENTSVLTEKVSEHLKKMGYSWMQ